MIRTAALLGTAALLLAGAGAVRAQEALAVTLDARTGAPLITVGGVLDDEPLREAVRSGLPLRLRFTVELWRDRWLDDLVAQAAWSAILAYEPLERLFVVGDEEGDAPRRFSDYEDARRVLERTWTPQVAPRERGRHYYIVTLEIETLSLSDLDELEHWLSGELEPAVRGSRSVPGALGIGVKRLLIRVLDLPARRFVARSVPFRVR